MHAYRQVNTHTHAHVSCTCIIRMLVRTFGFVFGVNGLDVPVHRIDVDQVLVLLCGLATGVLACGNALLSILHASRGLHVHSKHVMRARRRLLLAAIGAHMSSAT